MLLWVGHIKVIMKNYIVIPLSKTGKYAGQFETIVSSEDADLSELNWHASKVQYGRYACRKIRINGKSKTLRMHRIILERMLNRDLDEDEFVDHIDNDKLNNRRSNIRLATKSQNNSNVIKRNGTSKYKGVHWNKTRKKWVAQITSNSTVYSLGRYDNEYEAHKAYCEAAKKMHGDFARFE
jgi:hypothetical protein